VRVSHRGILYWPRFLRSIIGLIVSWLSYESNVAVAERPSFAEGFATSTKYEAADTAPASTAPAGKSKSSRSASLAARARADAEESDGLPPVAAPDNPKYGGRYFVDFRARTAASYGHAFQM
jgi:hypothetical protein